VTAATKTLIFLAELVERHDLSALIVLAASIIAVIIIVIIQEAFRIEVGTTVFAQWLELKREVNRRVGKNCYRRERNNNLSGYIGKDDRMVLIRLDDENIAAETQ